MEQQSLRTWLVIVVLVTLALGYIGLPIPNKPGADTIGFLRDRQVNLGLDLQGGSEIRVEFDLSRPEAAHLRDNPSKLKAAIEAAHETLSRRINLHGVKEPRIQIYGDSQILIQLPGQDRAEMERVKKILKTSGKLEFNMVDSNQQNLGVAKPGYKVISREEGDEPSEGHEQEKQLRVKSEAPLTGADVADAAAGFDTEGRGWEVSLKFHPRGTRTFAQLTTQNVHERFAIVLDGRLVSAPEIQEPIPSGTARITGNFDEKRAKDLATVLKSGSLAAPLKIAGENFVGPSLGQDSIRRGVWAGIGSVAAIFLFMLIYYRKMGIIANVAIIANVLLLLGALALLGATMTLPGIAGLVLSLAMAVDANILINERIREEVPKGKSPLQAFEAAYERAFITIFDSNITTLFAGIILYYVGTGPVQGFAVTLCIGIVTTMITALWFAKIITRYMLSTGSFNEFRMMHLFGSTSYKFSAVSRPVFLCSVLITLAGAGFVAWRGRDVLSIDFRGGTILNLKFAQDVDINAVRDGIRDIKDASGTAKYGDAEVQTVYEMGAKGEQVAKNEFQVRVGSDRSEEFEADLAKQFAGKLPPPPIEDKGRIEKAGAYQGAYQLRIGLSEAVNIDDFRGKLKNALASVVKDPAPIVLPQDEQTSTAFTVAVKTDAPLSEVEDALKKAKEDLKLAVDPFPFVSSIGSSVAKEMQSRAALALLLSWAAIIVYLAVRFEFIYGVAAVVALVFDVLLALGLTSLVAFLLPKAWGIDLDLGLSAVAAYLTIVGYSVNDKIVIFDRIRENLREMKRDPFSVVSDISINNTLARTVVTGTSVITTAVVLFLLTARSGGGIASFAFPFLVGVVVGTFSSMFIAPPVVQWWRGNRPVVA